MRSWKQHLFAAAGAPAIAAGLALAGAPATLAQDETPSVGPGPYPVGIHSGTCADPTVEPAYEVGDMTLVPVDASEVVDEVELLGEDELLGPADDAYLIDDLDDDGIFEEGIDLDEDGILDEDEVIEVVVDPIQRFVYKLDSDLEQFDGEELIREGPYVVAVHAGPDEYGEIIACGNVNPIVEEDRLIVPLRPVDGSGYSGVVMIAEDDGEMSGFLWPTMPAGASTPEA